MIMSIDPDSMGLVLGVKELIQMVRMIFLSLVLVGMRLKRMRSGLEKNYLPSTIGIKQQWFGESQV